MLREAGGNWRSGEELSRQLGVSRAAVAKHVRTLRGEGHQIEAMTRRGYRLLAEADVLTVDGVRRGLRTHCFGRDGFVLHETTDSTNREAALLALDGADEGAVVAASAQTAGRGRAGRVWASPAGVGVYVSLVLRPRLAPQAAPLVTLMTAVAVAEAVAEVTGLAPRAKWPNDVLLHGRKVSGNLTEVALVADTVSHVVTGAGINVNTRVGDLPEDLRGKATSLAAELGRPVSRVDVLRAFLERAEHWYAALREGDPGPVIARWKELSAIVGTPLRVGTPHGVVEGLVADVDPDGLLRLVDAGGREHRLHAGDVIDSRP
ncbi:biotin--[acetyl-CoA-carboxylase] ligase [Nitratidesulfovibrio sp.]|uniref:biotin--[acetyl-CoA-carboxylase] ligase n=1 Tax=Nitratidesulfovibrio sp. TaxID=2802297 RepID=UPI00334298BC